MEKAPYIILRVKGNAGAPAGNTPNLGPNWRGEAFAQAASGELELHAEAAVLDEQEVRSMHSDPEVGGKGVLARAMPVQLVHPVSDIHAEASSGEAIPFTWGVQATGALESPYTGQGVTVAVLDTGIDARHEAFQGVTLVEKDFTGEGNGDTNGHGTHVAGTIFGRTAQGLRYSVAPGVQRALIAKVLGANGGGRTDQIVAAIQWAVDQGAQILNMSLSIDFPGFVSSLVAQGHPVAQATSVALQQFRATVRIFDTLIPYLRARSALQGGALLVAATGNESNRNGVPGFTIGVGTPAAAEGILAVAALQSPGAPHNALTVAPFSNTNPVVAGPGVNIRSARAGGGYHNLSGTSMASPHVAGVAALWADRQLQTTGRIDIEALYSQVAGNASRRRLVSGLDSLDVGLGLAVAPAG